MEKRPWFKPELIVLIRNKPEEAVLTGCKGDGSLTSSLFHNDGCHSDSDPCVTMCSDQVAS
jgi:hypothetical protein